MSACRVCGATIKNLKTHYREMHCSAQRCECGTECSGVYRGRNKSRKPSGKSRVRTDAHPPGKTRAKRAARDVPDSRNWQELQDLQDLQDLRELRELQALQALQSLQDLKNVQLQSRAPRDYLQECAKCGAIVESRGSHSCDFSATTGPAPTTPLALTTTLAPTTTLAAATTLPSLPWHPATQPSSPPVTTLPPLPWRPYATIIPAEAGNTIMVMRNGMSPVLLPHGCSLMLLPPAPRTAPPAAVESSRTA